MSLSLSTSRLSSLSRAFIVVTYPPHSPPSAIGRGNDYGRPGSNHPRAQRYLGAYHRINRSSLHSQSFICCSACGSCFPSPPHSLYVKCRLRRPQCEEPIYTRRFRAPAQLPRSATESNEHHPCSTNLTNPKQTCPIRRTGEEPVSFMH